jgi:primosomal protein N' (replication factor Y)
MEVYESEMKERRKFGYPPYVRLILLTFRHKQLELVDYCSARYHQELLKIFPDRNLLGPEYPYVSRVNNRYNKHIVVKIDSSFKLSEIKERLTQLNHTFFASKEFRSVRLVINVDPQ